jgi:hypothetical protein
VLTDQFTEGEEVPKYGLLFFAISPIGGCSAFVKAFRTPASVHPLASVSGGPPKNLNDGGLSCIVQKLAAVGGKPTFAKTARSRMFAGDLTRTRLIEVFFVDLETNNFNS